MSYCRWSSDNFNCDLYCYEDASGGWTTHVAGNRTVEKAPELSDVLPLTTEEGIAAWVAARKVQSDWLMTAERRPIGLPNDGKTFNDPTLEDFRERIVGLIAEGYRVPDYVLTRIDEEIAEKNNGPVAQK